MLDLSFSVLNLVKVCHKSVSLVIAICTLLCFVSNCFFRHWTVSIDFSLLIIGLLPTNCKALTDVLIENDRLMDGFKNVSKTCMNLTACVSVEYYYTENSFEIVLQSSFLFYFNSSQTKIHVSFGSKNKSASINNLTKTNQT